MGTPGSESFIDRVVNMESRGRAILPSIMVTSPRRWTWGLSKTERTWTRIASTLLAITAVIFYFALTFSAWSILALTAALAFTAVSMVGLAEDHPRVARSLMSFAVAAGPFFSTAFLIIAAAIGVIAIYFPSNTGTALNLISFAFLIIYRAMLRDSKFPTSAARYFRLQLGVTSWRALMILGIVTYLRMILLAFQTSAALPSPAKAALLISMISLGAAIFIRIGSRYRKVAKLVVLAANGLLVELFDFRIQNDEKGNSPEAGERGGYQPPPTPGVEAGERATAETARSQHGRELLAKFLDLDLALGSRVDTPASLFGLSFERSSYRGGMRFLASRGLQVPQSYLGRISSEVCDEFDSISAVGARLLMEGELIRLVRTLEHAADLAD